MQIPNPNQDQPLKVYKDANDNELYGVRNEGADDEEIVDMRTNRSNHTYYQPEVVFNPSNCEHEYVIIDQSKREVECVKCQDGTTGVLGVNLVERDGQVYLKHRKQEYLISV